MSIKVRRWKLIPSDRGQISGCLRAGTGSGDSKGRKGDYTGVLNIFTVLIVVMASQVHTCQNFPSDTL